MSSNFVSTYLNRLLRLEFFVLFASSVYFYQHFDGDWLYFFLGLLAIDFSMIGYLANNTFGRITYNLGHNFVLPGLLILAGYANDNRTAVLVALVWVAHVSMDRGLGYGLKLQDFKHTHLGIIGKQKRS